LFTQATCRAATSAAADKGLDARFVIAQWPKTAALLPYSSAMVNGRPAGDDPMPGRARPPLSKSQRRRIIRWLHTDVGMERFLDRFVGPGEWVYDPDADVWVVPDRDYTGSGRALLVVQRGGDWRRVVLPEEALS
jgi:hypothetical protein